MLDLILILTIDDFNRKEKNVMVKFKIFVEFYYSEKYNALHSMVK